MVKYLCIDKIRNKQGQIVSYLLKDEKGTVLNVNTHTLKSAIQKQQAVVVNLTLTKANRLIDYKQYKGADVFAQTPVVVQNASYSEITYHFIRTINKAKALTFISNVSNLEQEGAKYKLLISNSNVTLSENKHILIIETDDIIKVLSDLQFRLADSYIDRTSDGEEINRGVFKNTKFTSIDLHDVDTSHTTDMSYLFEYCHAQKLNLTGFNTTNVFNMEGMFRRYKYKLDTLDVSMFDTSNVKNMKFMFEGDYIKELDLRSFDISNVVTMINMFYDFHSKLLDLRSFHLGRSKDNMRGIFTLSAIKEIKISDVNIMNRSDMNFRFKKESFTLCV